MRSYKEIEKKYRPEEIAESYVFPNDLDSLQRAHSLEVFQNWRKKNESKRSVKSKLITKLLQLKFVMEDYIMQKEYKEDFDFSYFLVEYIDRLEIKKKEFAQEIDVNPTELSQIINRHRSPNEKFIIRLEIHSNKNFPAIIWSKIIEKERIFRLQNDTKLRLSECKHVRSKLDFTF
jgi:hypothetical protein